MANLPQDVIMEILSRVPVKSLLRFRCVSKTWCSFVANPSFAKKHLNQATQNNNPSLIFSHCFNLYSIDYEESDVAAVKLDLPFTDFIDRVELSGSCNGLVCISDHSRNEDIYLCNPSNREYMKLPVPCFDVPTNEHTCFTSLGFGYHPAMDDYKVIRIIYLYDKPLKNIDSYECEARIYSLGTNSWRKIGHVPLHVSTRCSVVLGNGILLWKASRGNGLTMSVSIASFDMEDEKFREIPLPDIGHGDFYMELAVFGGFVSVFCQFYNERVEIWLMKEYGVKESWTKQFVVGRPTITGMLKYLKPLAFLKSGEILLEKSENGLILYDPVNKKVRDLSIRRTPNRFSAITYMGTLTSFASLRTGTEAGEQATISEVKK